mmetsp:Transcript_145248/g.465362  ORF Transcript_145248/g.465362 Transcript_145248/m.465362 type:complete len:1009 (+) Transcript_145248:40-3066(+)
MVENLGEALANASRDLEERSGIGSASSEERDALEQSHRVQEELEKRSSASSVSSRKRHLQAMRRAKDKENDDAESCASWGTAKSVKAVYKTAGVPEHGTSRSRPEKSLPPVTPIIDKVELAVLEVKRAAMERAAEGTHSGSGSNVGSANGSGSGSHPSFAHGFCSSVSSTPLPFVDVVPSVVLQNLSRDNQELVQNVVGKVVETTGRELAEMQAALDRAKWQTLEDGHSKLEMQATFAKMKAKIVVKENLVDNLANAREMTEQVRDERDDLHDKLIGMETLLNSKMERYSKEVEEMRTEAKKREDELKKKFEADRIKLIEELNAASKEVEKAKKQKIAVASERDVIRRAELVSHLAVEAEKKALQAELFAAKVKLGEDPDLQEVLEYEDFDEKNMSVIEKLKVSKASNSKLSREFEKLRLDLITAHQEKDEEIAELKSKVEGYSNVHLGGKANKGRRSKPVGTKFKLSSIDEEEDDIGSQAGSGVSGQVSSDSDGVGDLRDFDDYAEEKDGRLHDQHRAEVCEVQKLRDELRESEAWYKNIEELKKAKDKEHTSKIDRLMEQMQAWRQEALNQTAQVEKVTEMSEEVAAENKAEVLQVKQQLLEIELVENVQDDFGKRRELEEKLGAYASQTLELRDQVTQYREEKRILQLRLDDTRHDLVLTEQRHKRQLADLQTQFKIYGDGSNPEAAEEAEGELLAKIRSLEEEKNMLKNELECQEVLSASRLEEEQHKSAAALAKLHEEQILLEKERDLKDQVEQSFQHTKQLLLSTRQALKEAEGKARQSEAQAQAAQIAAARVSGWMFSCPRRSAGLEVIRSPSSKPEAHSTQAIIWQVISTLGGVAALFCADETCMISDASKKAFAMWGSATLRGASLYSLVFDKSMASWLKSELSAPAMSPFMKPGASNEFWLRELGCVEFRSKLGSAFDASVTCARLPEEPAQGRQAAILVVIEPVAEEQQQMRMRSQPAPAMPSNLAYRRGPASITSSVHSEDITANDSVSNVHTYYK